MFCFAFAKHFRRKTLYIQITLIMKRNFYRYTGTIIGSLALLQGASFHRSGLASIPQSLETTLYARWPIPDSVINSSGKPPDSRSPGTSRSYCGERVAGRLPLTALAPGRIARNEEMLEIPRTASARPRFWFFFPFSSEEVVDFRFTVDSVEPLEGEDY